MDSDIALEVEKLWRNRVKQAADTKDKIPKYSNIIQELLEIGLKQIRIKEGQ